jgi:hypothetical protein
MHPPAILADISRCAAEPAINASIAAIAWAAVNIDRTVRIINQAAGCSHLAAFSFRDGGFWIADFG